MNVERRTSNIERPTSNNEFCPFKEKTKRHAAQAPALHERICPSNLDSAAFDNLRPRTRRGESLDSELTTEEPVAGCGSLFLKSIKRSVVNIRRSMLGVRCSTFNLFTAPVRRNFIRAAPLAKKTASLIGKETMPFWRSFIRYMCYKVKPLASADPHAV